MVRLWQVAMSVFTIHHMTTYRYRRPVAFGEHRMVLRPRDDDRQQVVAATLDISPPPAAIDWSRDGLGNLVALARFEAKAAELRVGSTVHVRRALRITAPAGPAPFAAEPPLPPVAVSAADWALGFRAGGRDDHAVVAGMTGFIGRAFRHVSRYEPGIQSPEETLALGSGSCRDVAALMIAALRTLGIGARFVSGYLHLPKDDPERTAGGNMHAWVEADLGGGDWIDVDPSRGVVGNGDLIRVAVVDEPGEAIPLQGTWFGDADDCLGMDVAVMVRGRPAL